MTNIKISIPVSKIESELTLARKYQNLGIPNFPEKRESTKKAIRQYKNESNRSSSST